jgi:hypothetical protein
MMAKQKSELLKGVGTHRRTESDYMGVMLDAVTLDDWRDVITGTLQLAKGGDPSARAWLAQYLVGKPETKASTPLTVVVNQWGGKDPVAERLAKPLIDRELYPAMHQNDAWQEGIRSAIATELAGKLPPPEIAEDQVVARVSAESAEVVPMQLAK